MIKLHYAVSAFALAGLTMACGGGGQPAADANAAAGAAGGGNTAAAPAAGSAAQIKTCSGDTQPAGDGLIDDFEDNDNAAATQGGRQGYWWAGGDEKGSTVEPKDLKGNMGDGGSNGSKKALHVTGKTASVDGAWGVGIGVGLGANKQPYDGSKYAGISFFAKAGPKSTKNIRFKVSDVNTHPDGAVCKDGCWNHFGKDITLTDQWQEYKVTFAEMKQQDGWGDPHPPAITVNKLFDVNWSVDKGQEYDVWLDDIKFIDCK